MKVLHHVKSGCRFGILTTIESGKREYRDNGTRISTWVCRCDCGNIKIIRQSSLVSGNTRSCGNGCLARKWKTTSNKAEFLSEYRIWSSMKSRCTNKNTAAYRYYGDRGIKVCERWMNSFEDFLNDMGRRLSKNHSIDRINNDGNYEPNNCRWATSVEQNRNKRKTILIVNKNIDKMEK